MDGNRPLLTNEELNLILDWAIAYQDVYVPTANYVDMLIHPDNSRIPVLQPDPTDNQTVAIMEPEYRPRVTIGQSGNFLPYRPPERPPE